MNTNHDDKNQYPAIGKARFNDFAQFKHWYLNEGGHVWLYKDGLFKREIYHRQKLISDMAPGMNRMYENRSEPHYGAETTISDLETIERYINTLGGQYDLLLHEPEISVIRFGGRSYLLPTRFLSVKLYPDYTEKSLHELNRMLAPPVEGNGETQSGEIAPAAALSIKDIQTQMREQDGQLENVQAEIQRIEEETRQRIEAIKEEARRQIEKVEFLKLGLMTKVEELRTQIFKLEAAIYTVECYIGDTVDFIQLRQGNSAPLESPLVVYQKLRYLDEDLAVLMSIYHFRYEKSELFEQALASRDDLLDYFCPGEKCIAFVRVSKTGTVLARDGDMLREYELLHGKTIGILLRNGENLYFGWTDEAKIFMPGGDAFFSPKEMELQPGEKAADEVKYPSADYSQEEIEALSPEERKALEDKDFIAYQKHQRAYNTRAALSKLFVFSIIQGLLDDEERALVKIPEKVHLLNSRFAGSRYLILSNADGWLADNRYGDFSQILERFDRNHKAGDTILTTSQLYDGRTNQNYTAFERSRDGTSRTHDCHISDMEFYVLNLVEEKKEYYSEKPVRRYYVSVAKQWSDAGARSNFQVYRDEFINLTFLNSEWLRYAILNKKIGSLTINGRSVSYAHAVHYLKVILEQLEKRETEENTLISAHIPGLTTCCPTWMVYLSEWKFEKGVRRITAYQAKRFTRHLVENNIIAKEDYHDTD